jgi:hypothetical protein
MDQLASVFWASNNFGQRQQGRSTDFCPSVNNNGIEMDQLASVFSK